MNDCIFCKIANGTIPSRKIYEDEDLFAFHDIHPQAPLHFMVIPKPHIASLNETHAGHEALLGKLFAKIGELARAQGATEGFRTIINTGKVGGQEVYHLHVHVLSGPEPLGRMLSRQ